MVREGRQELGGVEGGGNCNQDLLCEEKNLFPIKYRAKKNYALNRLKLLFPQSMRKTEQDRLPESVSQRGSVSR